MNLVCPAATGGSLRHGKDGTGLVCVKEPLGNTQFFHIQMPPGSGVYESWKEAAGVFRVHKGLHRIVPSRCPFHAEGDLKEAGNFRLENVVIIKYRAVTTERKGYVCSHSGNKG